MNLTPRTAQPEPDGPTRARLRLMTLIVIVLVTGFGLSTVAGPPRLPTALPAPGDLTAVLGGSVLPLEALAMLLVSVTWLVWLWVIGSLVLGSDRKTSTSCAGTTRF